MIGGGPSLRYLIAAAADDEEDDNEDEEDNDGGGAMNTPRLSAFGSMAFPPWSLSSVVGEHNLDQALTNIGEHSLDQTLTNDRPSELVVGQSKENMLAPIKIVDGSPWSPNVYRNLRLIGMNLEEAWKKAFIRVSHF